MKVKRHNRTRDLVADVIRELIAAPRNRAELKDLCELHETSQIHWLNALIDAGVVWRIGDGTHRSPYVYHLCRVPFEAPPSALEVQACA